LRKIVIYSRTSLNRYSGITRGFEAFFYAIVTENVAEIRGMEICGFFAFEKEEIEGLYTKKLHSKCS
jgi:hypothetical protein